MGRSEKSRAEYLLLNSFSLHFSNSLQLCKIRTLQTPEWRNWQTRCVQGAVGFKPVGVRIPSPAPPLLICESGYLEQCRTAGPGKQKS